MKPVLVYDGDCGFCKQWIERWRSLTEEAVDYLPYQDVYLQYPQIKLSSFQTAVQLIDSDQTISSGAEAVFKVLAYAEGKAWFWHAYRSIPGIKPIADFAYKIIALHRPLFSKLTQWFWGPSLDVPSYSLSKNIFIRCLSLVYLVAFYSLGGQVLGLIGAHGILPVSATIHTVWSQLGLRGFWFFPTLCWINSNDLFLVFLCWAGVGLSVLAFLSVAPRMVLIALWVMYLSLATAGREFMSFQWDALLLEAGFLAIWLAPWKWRAGRSDFSKSSDLIHFAMKWLLFRLMFSSGVVKLTSGDLAWRNLTALTFHYETQPLLPWTAWYMHQLPVWFHQMSAVLMFGIELICPFFIFFPRRIRNVGAWAIIFLMACIILTGNYCFFNWLTIALALLVIDDQFWCRKKSITDCHAKPHRFTKSVISFLILLSLIPMTRLLFGVRIPRPISNVYGLTTPFSLVNHYGLFAVMTKDRPEIIIEGSEDGITWKEYDFKYKIGELAKRPEFVAPHQPRLDWQLWFAALSDYRENPWFVNLCIRLLEGEKSVLKLIGQNPFSEKPPKMIRANLYTYRFTDRNKKKASGVWWVRERKNIYLPTVSLKQEGI